MVSWPLQILGAASLFAIGCAAQMQYTPTSTQGEPKFYNCPFAVLTTRPPRPFEELGIIDFTGGHFFDGRRTGVPENANEFKSKAAQYVCHSGGDAVLADVNGMGQYIRGTVIRYKPE